MKHLPRTPLLWIILGFLGGVVITRNSAPMSHPEKGTVIVAMLVGGFVMWKAGYKGKREAVANAVAIATATAKAEATANAQAIIQFYNSPTDSPEWVYDLDALKPILVAQEQATTREIECSQSLSPSLTSSQTEPESLPLHSPTPLPATPTQRTNSRSRKSSAPPKQPQKT